MKIKITSHIPTIPSPEVGKEYEVIRIDKYRANDIDLYFIECDGVEVGIWKREMEIVIPKKEE